MNNLIYLGAISDQPRTVSRPVTGALLPGTAVKDTGAALVQLTAGGDDRILILGNRDFFTQTNTDAYVSGETGHAYRLRLEDDYNVALAGATYAVGDELTVGASGRFTAATSGSRVVAFYNGTAGAVTAGDLQPVVIANSYVKA